MKTIKELIHTKQHQKNLEVPDMNNENQVNNVHILFFSPKLNANGYYRMLLPYLELAKTHIFKTHLIGLTKEDFNTPFELAKVPLLDEWVLWADYIVFPILTKEFMYFFKACRVINPELQIVMDVDVVLHALAPQDPLRKKTSKEMLNALADNLNLVDIITAPNEYILDFYTAFLKEKYHDTTTYFAHTPNLVSPIGYEDIIVDTAKETEKVHVGILVTQRYAQDLMQIIAPLIDIQRKYKDKVTFLVYGWNGMMRDGSKPLAVLDIEYHKTVSFIQHLEKLSTLQLDIALLPMQNKASRRFASDIPYLELSSFGIPAIASKHSVFKEFIIDGQTGVLVDGDLEWLQVLDKLIEDEPYRKKLGKAAKELVWRHHSYADQNLEPFTELFF